MADGAAKTTAAGGAVGVLALCSGLVMYYEGYVPRGYADVVGVPTVCYGHTGTEVRIGDSYTREQCRSLLEGDLAAAYATVMSCIHVPLAPHEAAALTSATFNAGPKIVCGSTLQKLANRGESPQVWCGQLRRWIYAKGIKLNGLIRRRNAETKLCLGDVDGALKR